MNRRQLLALAASGAGAALMEKRAYSFSAVSGNDQAVQIRVDETAITGSIPRDFVGLGYEVSSVARPGLLSATNSVYVQLVKTLGNAGVIRIGGNTIDYSSYSADGKAISSPKSTVINKDALRELGSFLEATGWKLIWCLNLGGGRQAEAVEEAEAVNEVAKDKLLALEIGNEVDLFVHEGHRQNEYAFANYLEEYRRFKTAIRAKLPHVPFAGPDAAGKTAWVSQFAAAEGSDLKLLTEHYYRGNQNPTSSLDMLLNPDPKLTAMLETLKQLSSSSRIPYRICETNSFSGGGKPGVSGTFGAALWVLDYMVTLASNDAAGVNIETGVNQLGFVSSYSPIGDDEHGSYTARPEYYGMLAFSQASDGQRVMVDSKAGTLNFSSYGVLKDRNVIVTLINKDRTRQANASIRCRKQISNARALRLTAPSLGSSTGVALGGTSVSEDGHWAAGQPEIVECTAGDAKIQVSPGSAAILTLLF